MDRKKVDTEFVFVCSFEISAVKMELLSDGFCCANDEKCVRWNWEKLRELQTKQQSWWILRSFG